jgi:hypothetical protein
MTYELGTAPSKWTQNQLNYLNVRYNYRHEYSFGPLQRLQVPEALTQGQITPFFVAKVQ